VAEEKVDRSAIWTPEKREEQRKKLKEYYQSHEGPMAGRHMTDESRQKMKDAREQMEVKGHCKRCGRPLYSEDAVKLGYGPECFEKVLEETENGYDVEQLLKRREELTNG